MALRTEFDKIELHLIRVFHTLITERSVSRAALRLQSSQPAVSAQLKRLRELTGDPLLVRAGNGMTPTAFALQMLVPATNLLNEADRLFSQRTRRAGFDPQTSTTTFRIAASDFIDPGFLPQLVLTLKQRAPQVKIELLTLSSHFDYRRSLAQGEVDLVIGNWLHAARRTAPGPAGQRRGGVHGGRGSPDRARRQRARVDGRALPGVRARGAHAQLRGRARRHRRPPGQAGPAARHRRAQRPLRADPLDGGRQPAGAHHGAAVLPALRRRAAGAHRALPRRLPAAGLLPAVARPQPRIQRRSAGCASGARRRAQRGARPPRTPTP